MKGFGKEEFLKSELDEHTAATDHLAMAVEKISLLTDRLPPLVFKMKEFGYHRDNKIVWHSPPFYSIHIPEDISST